MRSGMVVLLVLTTVFGAIALSPVPAQATPGVTPVITSLEPPGGSAGTVVEIRGSGFTGTGIPGSDFPGATRVRLDHPTVGPELEIVSVTDTVVRAIMPKVLMPQPRSVFVTTDGGSSAPTAGSVFTYGDESEVDPINRNIYPDSEAYNHELTLLEEFPDWMGNPAVLPDNRLLSDVSMPGTHDTGSYGPALKMPDTYGLPDAVVLPIGQTQRMNLTEQLESGIRALDIRVGRHDSGVCSGQLFVFHGDFGGGFCWRSLGDTIHDIYEFLRDHPTEFVVMRLGDAGTPDNTNYPGDTCQELSNYHDYFYDGVVQDPSAVSDPRNPQVRDLRGKIYMMNDFSGAADGGPTSSGGNCKFSDYALPLDYSQQGAGGLLRNQDAYEWNDLYNIADKWDRVQQQFDKTNASASTSQDLIWMNWLSASADGTNAVTLHPCQFAGGREIFQCQHYTISPFAHAGVWGTIWGDGQPCSDSPRCDRMVKKRLYQLNACLSVDAPLWVHACTARYVGLNAMAEAYVGGSNQAGADSPDNSSNPARSPQWPGLAKAGMVFADFPGEGLIKSVIRTNMNAVTAFGAHAPNDHGWYDGPVDIKVACTGDFYATCPRSASTGKATVVQTVTAEGINTVRPSVTDANGRTMLADPIPIRIDTSAPLLCVPNDIHVDASTATGAVVDFTVRGVDISFDDCNAPFDHGSGIDTTACSHASGSEFAAGTTTVECFTQDRAGNRTEKSFKVYVKPKITAAATTAPNEHGWYNQPVDVHFTCLGTDACPADVHFDEEGPFSSTAEVIESPDGTLNDTANIVTGQIDLQAPVFNPTVVVDATSPAGGFASVDASDSRSGVRETVCDPPREGIFAIGDTALMCSAEDFAGNSIDDVAVTVQVQGRGEQAVDLIARAEAVADTTLVNKAKAVKTALDKNQTITACARLGEAALRVDQLLARGTLSDQSADALLEDIANLAGTLGGCAFQAPTTTTVSSFNPNPAVTGQPVAVTAHVSVGGSGAAVVGGTLQFFVDDEPAGTPVPVKAGGVATKTLALTPHARIRADYLGSAKNRPSQSAEIVAPVNAADTTTTLSTTPALSGSAPGSVTTTYGQKLTLKAKVAVVAPGKGTPTGTVFFYDYGAPSVLLGEAPVVNGTATLELPTGLSGGLHFLLAFYQLGDFKDSFSPQPSVLVAKGGTVTKMTVPQSKFGESTTFSATVTSKRPYDVVPTGTVTFTDQFGIVVGDGPVPLDENGTASLPVSFSPAGVRTITASYSGSADFEASSASAKQTVTVDTTVTLTASPNPIASGGAVHLTASVVGSNGAKPGGSVRFYDGDTLLLTRALGANGALPGLAGVYPKLTGARSHPIRAEYVGKAPYNASTSAVVDVIVGTGVNGNDDFLYAKSLSGASGTTAGSNDTATSESGEPAAVFGPSKSVWYRWTAPETGTAMFDTCTSSFFDTMLAAYTGTALNALTRVTDNDDDCGVRSRIRFAATAGQGYLIQVDGRNDSSGPFTLTWSMANPPANDLFAAATEISGLAGSIDGDLQHAAAEPGEPGALGTGAQNSVWYAWTAPVSGLVTMDTCSGWPFVDSDIGVYTGSAVATLTSVASAEAGCDDGDLARVTFPADAGTIYRVVVDSPDFEGDDVPFTLSWSMRENDNYVLPVGMQGGDGSIRGTTVGMTPYTGEEEGGSWEPATCATECSPSEGPNTTAWYDWQAPADGTVTIDTCTETDFDTLLAVYTLYPDVTRVAESNDAAGCGDGTQSRVTFPTTRGTNYHVQVDSRAGGATGHFRLSWSFEPANDDLADAIEVAGPSGTTSSSIDGASTEAGEPRPCNGGEGCGWNVDGPSHTVWYRWTAPEAGTATFDTCSTGSADTMLAAYGGDEPPAFDTLTRVADNNDGCGFKSRITFPVNEGAAFFIQVDGERNHVGTFTLRWALTPANDAFAAAKVITGASGSVDGSNVYAGNEANEPATCVDCQGTWDGPRKTMWYRWVAPAAGDATIDTCTNEAFDTMLAVYTGEALNALTRVANDDAGCGFLTSRVTFAASAGTTYWIQVDGWIGRNGPFTLSWDLEANDDFANVFVLTGPSGTTDGSNAGATAEDDEPATCDGSDGCDGLTDGPNATTWYAWQAPASDLVATFDTCTDADFDTMLAIYATSPFEPAPVRTAVANDSTCANDTASRASFTTVAGTTYYIQVDGVAGATGTYTLQWSARPLNDNIGAAGVLTGATGAAEGSTSYATNRASTGEPATCVGCEAAPNDFGPEHTVWYAWTAPTSGAATFGTCAGPGVETMLAVYSATGYSDLSRVANSNANGGCSGGGSVSFTATEGVTYYVQVDSAPDSLGDFDLTWSLT